MGDSVITVVAIFLAGVLMFVFPLLSVAERNDDIAELAAQTATTEFVNSVKTTGAITNAKYGAFLQELNATGNTFDVDLEIKVLDKNLSKKLGQANQEKIGENETYTLYTSQIEELLETEKKYILKEGDTFTVTVKNTNKTIAQMLKSFFYSITGNDGYQIAASDSALITVNGK